MNENFLPRQHPLLYEINTAAWLFDLTRETGEKVLMGNVPGSEWDRLKSQGMDYVWLMGVWNRSEEGRKLNIKTPEFRANFQTVLPECRDEDIIGSCYAISSYGPDPLVGTWEDLDKARDELHTRGMGLILDFVPNHTGTDHHWIHEHPEYYIQATLEQFAGNPESFFQVNQGGRDYYFAHGRDPNFPPWTDTAQLNYFNPETRQAMIGRIDEISKHCDGIRCDMAMLELNSVFQNVWGWANRSPTYTMPAEEFWTEVTRTVPELVYIAEAYWDTEYTLQQLGFDFVYDKRLYDRVKNRLPIELNVHLKANISYQSKLVRFIENHDELRSAAVFNGKIEAAAAMVAALPGLKLFFHGQFEGKRLRLPVQIRQTRPETSDPAIRDFYNRLMPVVNQDIFHSGIWKLKEVFAVADKSAAQMIAQSWQKDGTICLVLANLGPEKAHGRISFQNEIHESGYYRQTAMLGGKSETIRGKIMAHPGLIFELPPFGAEIYEFQPVTQSLV